VKSGGIQPLLPGGGAGGVRGRAMRLRGRVQGVARLQSPRVRGRLPGVLGRVEGVQQALRWGPCTS
jgi:hypothetical protein